MSVSIRGTVHLSIRLSLLHLSSCYYSAYLLLFAVAICSRYDRQKFTPQELWLVFLLQRSLIQAQKHLVNCREITRSFQKLVTWNWVSKQTLFSQPFLLVRRSFFSLQTFDLGYSIWATPFLNPCRILLWLVAFHATTTTTKTAAEIREHDCGKCSWRVPVKWLMLCMCDWVSIEDLPKQIPLCNSVTYLVLYFTTVGTLALGLRLRGEWEIIMEIVSCF